MTRFTRQLGPAVRLLLVLTVLTGVLYPLAVTGIAQALFRSKADGSLVRNANGQVVGSSLLGQEFVGEGWFHGRPSAAGPGATGAHDVAPGIDVTDPANAVSGSSNLGPTNPDLLRAVQDRAVAYRSENGLAADALVPVDAVTASGSGVDPDISVANARLQAPRVARERGVPEDEILRLVDDATTGRTFGFLGEPGVNVLLLNLAVERAARS